MEHSLSFSCDYMEGAHPQILQRLVETNLEKTPGYGSDCYCEAAKAKIREACNAPSAEIFFLVGGTQTNATVSDAMLKSYPGVIAASTGHISVHEAGAIEFGGTKCGALFGEAVVIPKAGTIPHFFTIIKQHGALLAKGRLLGLQFDTLFTDHLYEKIGLPAIQAADRIRQILSQNGYALCFDSPTNQVFCIIENAAMERLAKQVEFGFWEAYDDTHTIIRFATSWATRPEDAEALSYILTK